jgi:hypothetical protein
MYSSSIADAAGYWKYQGNVQFCNPNMPPIASGLLPAGALHNGSVNGTFSSYLYQETRDWGNVTRWGETVHEYTKWEANFSGFPTQMQVGELVPIKASLGVTANTYRPRGTGERDIVNQVYWSTRGCLPPYPYAVGPDQGNVFVSLKVTADRNSQSGFNQYVRLPDNALGNQIYLIWRMGWGIADGGPKESDWIYAVAPYVWIDDTQPANPPLDNMRLGRVWRVSEGTSPGMWNGVYTRRGNSNTFDVVWTCATTACGGSSVSARGVMVLESLNGNQVTMLRDGTRYAGTWSGNRINGPFAAAGQTYYWDVTIEQ